MVQLLLILRSGEKHLQTWCALFLLLCSPLSLIAASKKEGTPVMVPQLELDGGRKLLFERTLSSDAEVKKKAGFWTRMLNVVAGEGVRHGLISPYAIVVDSQGRLIVTDPPIGGIHIFDFAQQSYKFISRDKEKNGLHSPQCVAVDASDNIYVTDSEAGKIFVFDRSGKFRRVIGSSRSGEGFFKRPTGIAIDSGRGRIYVTDTLRNQIFVLDMEGTVLQKIGRNGSADGEFNYPTEVRLIGDDLVVVDAMNFRIQVLKRSGEFQFSIGNPRRDRIELFRPKGVGVDSEGHFYIADGLSGVVQVFDREGQLLYYFGQRGTGFGEFQLPTDLFIDKKDRVYVIDSFNRRVQMFQYFGLKHERSGATQ